MHCVLRPRLVALATSLLLTCTACTACTGGEGPRPAAPSAAPSPTAAKPTTDQLAAQRIVDDDGMRFRIEAVARHVTGVTVVKTEKEREEEANEESEGEGGEKKPPPPTEGWEVDITVRAHPTDGGSHTLVGIGNSLNLFAQVEGDAQWASVGGGEGTPPRVIPADGEAVFGRVWDWEKPVFAGQVLRLFVKTYHEGTSHENHPLPLATAVLDLGAGHPPKLTVEVPLPDDDEPGLD